MDSGEEAGTQIMIEVFILAHFKHLFPLFHCHLVFNAFCSLFFISKLFSTKLNKGNQKNKNKTMTNMIITECKYCTPELTQTRPLNWVEELIYEDEP